jgi:hypothetical protein
VCVRPSGWSLRWFCHRAWLPQALARSDLSRAASGGAKLIGLFALTITPCLLLEVTMGAVPRAYQQQNPPVEWLAEKSAAAVISPAASASASASLTSGDHRLGSEGPLARISSDPFSEPMSRRDCSPQATQKRHAHSPMAKSDAKIPTGCLSTRPRSTTQTAASTSLYRLSAHPHQPFSVRLCGKTD